MENKILELLESATVEDLMANREIFARHGKYDQVAAIQEILDRKVREECGEAAVPALDQKANP